MVCIYKIESAIDGKVYIGQTINFNKRKNSHFSNLRKDTHFNSYLQRSFNKNGEENFSIEVVEECSSENLDRLEKHYIKYFKSDNQKYGFNMMSGGQINRGCFTEEVRKKMSESGKGKIFTDEHKKKIGDSNKGKLISEIAINKMKLTKSLNSYKHSGENNSNSVISDICAEEIIHLLLANMKVDEISSMYDISNYIVNNLLYNKSYKHIMSDIREKLVKKSESDFNEKLESAVKLYCNGMSQNEIAKNLNISRNSIRKELNKRSIDTKLHINQFIYANTEISKHIS